MDRLTSENLNLEQEIMKKNVVIAELTRNLGKMDREVLSNKIKAFMTMVDTQSRPPKSSKFEERIK